MDLLSLVSHELRTPLTSVLNAVRILREGELSMEERQKFLEMAYRNAERLNTQLNQLLDLSKLVSGRLICRFQEVSLKQLLLTAVDRFTGDAEAAGMSVQLTGRAEDLPVVLGDAPRLEQALEGIFENAMKFSPERSKLALKIRFEKQDGASFVRLELSNPLKKGAFADRREVFKVFGQQEGVLDREHEGVGGSLAIGAEVLRQHGGVLDARVEDGRFTVWMRIPVLESEQALLKVLESRIYALKTEVGEISLIILDVGPKPVKQLLEALKAALFRASDTVYALAETGQIAVVLDDCRKSDAPKIVRRLLEGLGSEAAKFLKPARVGLSSCPEDATNPEALLSRARESMVALSEL